MPPVRVYKSDDLFEQLISPVVPYAPAVVPGITTCLMRDAFFKFDGSVFGVLLNPKRRDILRRYGLNRFAKNGVH